MNNWINNWFFLGLLVLLSSLRSGWAEDSADLYVAREGNDAWSGKIPAPNGDLTDGPLATLEHARDEVRRLQRENHSLDKPFCVEIKGGCYERETAFVLTKQDSGTASAPIEYRAAKGSTVRLIGGKQVSHWKPVSDPAVLQQLDESIRGKILQADLKSLGVTDYGEIVKNRLEVFHDGEPLTLARYPNLESIRIVEALGDTPRDVRGTKGTVEGKFSYEGDRPSRWQNEPDGWLHGYWFWDWAEQRQRISSIDPINRIIELEGPPHYYGYRKGQWFYAFNLLSELDTPGEYYLDHRTGMLYVYPGDDKGGGETLVSLIPTSVEMNEVSYVSLRGLMIEAFRGNGVRLMDCQNVSLIGCTLRNIGSDAIQVDGGRQNRIMGCDVFSIGEGGISLSGGDQSQLIPAGHLAENNEIHHCGRWKPTYSAGITLVGVGNQARHNLIHNVPHIGIVFRGNNHLLEFNELHHVCTKSNDTGAIYSGRNWTWRGTVIRHNYLHDLFGLEDRGCIGVYLDDMLCGTQVFGNLFVRVHMATAICGGRDCTVENNLFVDCPTAVHVDDRGLNWADEHTLEWIQEAREKGTIQGVLFNKPPYSDQYPQLVNLLEEAPGAPRGNSIVRNISSGGAFDDLAMKEKNLVRFVDNVTDQDPKFVDRENGNYQLRDDSPALPLGFKRLPFKQMGLSPSEDRASHFSIKLQQ